MPEAALVAFLADDFAFLIHGNLPSDAFGIHQQFIFFARAISRIMGKKKAAKASAHRIK
jgi:hypothetical protein